MSVHQTLGQTVAQTLRRLAFLLPLSPGYAGVAPDALVVHEWGTFTSVAAQDGTALGWAPLTSEPDLPCFVNHLGPQNGKLSLGLVRMETPVLYFYSQQPREISVQVDFPQGWITDWYPRATTVTAARPAPPAQFMIKLEKGQIHWDRLQLMPAEANPAYPSTAGPSRYFAARNTDSVPLRIDGQQEKFLFYRGIGNFALPLEPRYLSDGRIEIRNVGVNTVPLAIVFENRAGKVGYRFVRGIAKTENVSAPELTGSLDDLRAKLAASLVEMGLYEREAAAMLATWQDSWFEEGARVFYLLPPPSVDSVLPLEIVPLPSLTTRVFVGRVEMVSPAVRDTITTAMKIGDVATLTKFGRFLNPFLQQLGGTGELGPSPAATEFLERAYTKIAQQFNSRACIH